jgi:hypothetical protein
VSRRDRKHPMCQTCRCVDEYWGRTNCAWCGEEFVKSNPDHALCSPQCRYLRDQDRLASKIATLNSEAEEKS